MGCLRTLTDAVYAHIKCRIPYDAVRHQGTPRDALGALERYGTPMDANGRRKMLWDASRAVGR